jgi:spermidine synthase
MPAPLDRPASVDDRPPLIRTDGDRRTLEFTPGDVQSEMLVSRPDALVLEYTRAMMCFALFVPDPHHILMVGLGGGSLVKFCHRHFPRASITVLEIREDVIALRDQFCLPPDDARLRVLHCDAADYLARMPGCCDVLLVDGFDSQGLPSTLTGSAFYAACRRALHPGGVLVANVFTYDPQYAGALQRLRTAFDGRLAWFARIAGNNRILFAVHPAAPGARPGRGERLLARMACKEGRGLG